ncbi:hypothetical protein [Bacteriovorax sp. Seq25_V]|uniref:hypothetical protein n=1 Tax=Bacteriovorax sp. Seq25_V TaxID=1201288 RepID=UPI000389DC9A|nr:hypothetical protein [Bacteriovorax sp. Seq25_V]EQC45543.1 hypothetical protein M900_2101 [Bacteriovorax sp. Seq25_V]
MTTELIQAEAIKNTKNFRNSADIENFYRFVHENDLRFEAKKVFELIMQAINEKTKKKTRKSRKVQ